MMIGKWGLTVAGALALAAVASGALAREAAVRLPPPAVDEPVQAKSETIVLAGGCFWGVQLVFQHVNGVTSAVSGFSGGNGAADYESVSSGTTGHAEAVEIVFDPSVVSLGTILQIYFSVAHDPTQLNRQGPDVGTQYRSAIFATSDAQAKIASAYIAQIDKTGMLPSPVVTTVGPMSGFATAEDYHQNYATLHPDNGYIARNDLPKLEALKVLFPERYREAPVLVEAGAAN